MGYLTSVRQSDGLRLANDADETMTHLPHVTGLAHKLGAVVVAWTTTWNKRMLLGPLVVKKATARTSAGLIMTGSCNTTR